MAKGAKVDLGLLFLRLTYGAMMLLGHGLGKISNLVAGRTDFADPLGIGATASLLLAGLAETLGSLGVIVGFKTRLAAVPVVITMLVAAFVHNAGEPWGEMEYPLLYCCAFLTLVIAGGGRYSLDARLKRRR